MIQEINAASAIFNRQKQAQVHFEANKRRVQCIGSGARTRIQRNVHRRLNKSKRKNKVKIFHCAACLVNHPTSNATTTTRVRVNTSSRLSTRRIPTVVSIVAGLCLPLKIICVPSKDVSIRSVSHKIKLGQIFFNVFFNYSYFKRFDSSL